MDGFEYYDGMNNIREEMRESATLMSTVKIIRTTAKAYNVSAHPDSARVMDVQEFPLKVELSEYPLTEVLQSGGVLLTGDFQISARVPLYATVNMDEELAEGVSSDVVIWKGAKWRIVVAPDIPRLHSNAMLFAAAMRFVTKLEKS